MIWEMGHCQALWYQGMWARRQEGRGSHTLQPQSPAFQQPQAAGKEGGSCFGGPCSLETSLLPVQDHSFDCADQSDENREIRKQHRAQPDFALPRACSPPALPQHSHGQGNTVGRSCSNVGPSPEPVSTEIPEQTCLPHQPLDELLPTHSLVIRSHPKL